VLGAASWALCFPDLQWVFVVMMARGDELAANGVAEAAGLNDLDRP